MTDPRPGVLPPRNAPATLPPRNGGLRGKFWTALGIIMFAAALVAMVVFTGPPLLSDWQVRNTARPTQAGQVSDGSCSTKLVLAICDATLTLQTPSGTVTRSVNYVFTDVHSGDYQVSVMADPARPELLTTDMALDRLWNRTITFLIGFVFLGGLVSLPLLALFRNRRQAAS